VPLESPKDVENSREDNSQGKRSIPKSRTDIKISLDEYFRSTHYFRQLMKDLEGDISKFESIEKFSFSDLPLKDIKKLLKVYSMFMGVTLVVIGFFSLLSWLLGGGFDFTKQAELGDTTNSLYSMLFRAGILIFICWFFVWYLHAIFSHLGRQLIWWSFPIMRWSRKLRIVVFLILGGTFWLTGEYPIFGLTAWILILPFIFSYGAYLDLLIEKASKS